MHLTTTALTACALALLLVFLSVTTIRMRMKHSAAFGDAGEQALTSAIRAHGNASEYIPAGLAGLTLLALSDSAVLPAWFIHAAGLSLTGGRILHPIGMHTGQMPLRAFGTLRARVQSA